MRNMLQYRHNVHKIAVIQRHSEPVMNLSWSFPTHQSHGGRTLLMTAAGTAGLSSHLQQQAPPPSIVLKEYHISVGIV